MFQSSLGNAHDSVALPHLGKRRIDDVAIPKANRELGL
jgi:hypothetical protein